MGTLENQPQEAPTTVKTPVCRMSHIPIEKPKAASNDYFSGEDADRILHANLIRLNQITEDNLIEKIQSLDDEVVAYMREIQALNELAVNPPLPDSIKRTTIINLTVWAKDASDLIEALREKFLPAARAAAEQHILYQNS